MIAHTVTLHLARETKGALRYEGKVGTTEALDSHDRLIGVLYLRKDGVQKYCLENGEAWPQTITVEVQPI